MSIFKIFLISAKHIIVINTEEEMYFGILNDGKMKLQRCSTKEIDYENIFLHENIFYLTSSTSFANYASSPINDHMSPTWQKSDSTDVFSYLREKNVKGSLKSIFLPRTLHMVNIYQAVEENNSIEVISFLGKSKRIIQYVDPKIINSMKTQVKVITELPNGDMAILQENNCITVLQIESQSLKKSLKEWKNITKVEENTRSLSIQYDGNIKKEVSGPKDGKVDPENMPHVGGNTWKGGSGGSDTAGLGGIGGPYRQDSNHPVHQISEEQKKSVSKEITERAREMAKKALEARLREIEMNENESEVYDKYLASVGREISSLRVILDGIEAKSRERVWLKNQTSGDFDDRKVVEGITGEKNIFKKRGNQDPEPGSFQQKPKRVRFVMDISGSMYRFNGQDQRLERLLQCTLMIMEAFHGYDHKYSYSIVGHSGDSPEIPLVDYGKPPKNRKERLKILNTMIAHSQYCMSGDSTLEAIEQAVKNVISEEADDHFVFAVSDANLRRYGIQPQNLSKVLQLQPKVNATAIFIASVGDEAERWKKSLPLGKAHILLDPKALPGVFKQIFSYSLLKDSKL